MKKIDPPKVKKDWPGKQLLLMEGWERGQCTPPDGIPATIDRRMNAMDTIHSANDVSFLGSERILKVTWRCQHCGARHTGYIPENWIADGKAFFVEQ